MIISEQEKIWDELAEKWSSYRNKTPEEITNFLLKQKGKVLDLGCGSGRNLIENKDIEYYCVDFSKEMLKFAKKNAQEKKIKAFFFKESAPSLSFKDNFFDAAIFISTLHCIESPLERKKALEELYRVLKKEAMAMITVWKKEKSKSTNWKKDGKVIPRHYYFYEESELKKILKEIGFKIIKFNEKETKSLIGKHSKKNFIVYVKK